MIISNYLYGWDHIEPIILGCVANNMHIMCTGKHGIGKSSFASFVAAGLSSDDRRAKAVLYNMPNEDMLSMVGCPMPKALAEGKFEFAHHNRSILDADIAVFDEVTRAPKETENMVLSILEERQVFGIDLPLKLVIATCNDATYKSTMSLDAAHMDRYVAVIPIPDMNGGTAADGTASARFGAAELEEMMRLNFGGRQENRQEADELLRDKIEEIRLTTEELWTRKNHKGECVVKDNVIEFCSKFMAQVMQNMISLNISNSKKGEEYYCSIREATRDFPKVVMACAAYYKVMQDDPDYLRSGAYEAIKYAISYKLLFPMDKLEAIYNNLKELLTDGDAAIAALKVQLCTGDVMTRINRLVNNVDTVRDHFDVDEQVNVIGMMLNELDLEDLEHVGGLLSVHDTLEGARFGGPAFHRAKVALTQYGFKKRLEMTLALDREAVVTV